MTVAWSSTMTCTFGGVTWLSSRGILLLVLLLHIRATYEITPLSSAPSRLHAQCMEFRGPASYHPALCLRGGKSRPGKRRKSRKGEEEEKKGESSELESEALRSDYPTSQCELSSIPEDAYKDISDSKMSSVDSQADEMQEEGEGEEEPESEKEESEDVERSSEDVREEGVMGEGEGQVPGDALMTVDKSERDLLQEELLNASRVGDCRLIRSLISQGADPNGKTKDNVEHGCIHLAVKGGHLEALETLTSLGADVSMECGTGDTVLHLASQHGHAKIVAKLLQDGFPVDAHGFGNRTAVFDASVKGHADVFALLVEHGADVNASDMWSSTSLHEAARFGRCDMIQCLVDAGADLEARDWGSRTPLHVAAEHGETEACDLFLELGASLEARAENDFNALEWAEWRGFKETAQLLRKAYGIMEDSDEMEVEGEFDGNVTALVERQRKSNAIVTTEESSIRNLLVSRKDWLSESRRVLIKTGKKKGLALYTDMAGRLVSNDQDMGPAIGRPSNAGVSHLKNKQCRAVDCTRTAYFGDPHDSIRRFCRIHRRETDIDVYYKAPAVPHFGKKVPLPWQLN